LMKSTTCFVVLLDKCKKACKTFWMPLDSHGANATSKHM